MQKTWDSRTHYRSSPFTPSIQRSETTRTRPLGGGVGKDTDHSRAETFLKVRRGPPGRHPLRLASHPRGSGLGPRRPRLPTPTPRDD